MSKKINLEEILFNSKYKNLTKEDKELIREGLNLITDL